MQTQLKCPRCQNQFLGEVHQIIDVGQDPELKQMILSGYLNLAQCPSCGAVTQVTTPLVYHDPEHELFLVHIPMELSLQHEDQEKLIGQLVRQAMDSLPPEQRRGYMLQPQTVLSMESLMEKVLEAEGITPEMIAAQRAKADLLQTLITADRSETEELIKERSDEIDESFFAVLGAVLETAENANQEEQALKLINLRAKLYRETEFGRRLERQQQVLRAFSREVEKAGGLSPKLLLKHVLANRDDDLIVEALISAGQPAFNYEFFVQLSDKIEKRQKAGIDAEALLELRERLLLLQQAIEKRSREVVEGAQTLLVSILEAEDRQAAVRANLPEMDDSFMYILSANVAEAQKRGDSTRASALKEVQDLIVGELERQAPPEIRLINQLLGVESEEERRNLLGENAHLATPEFLQMVKALRSEVSGSGDNKLDDRLGQIQTMVELRMQT